MNRFKSRARRNKRALKSDWHQETINSWRQDYDDTVYGVIEGPGLDGKYSWYIYDSEMGRTLGSSPIAGYDTFDDAERGCNEVARAFRYKGIIARRAMRKRAYETDKKTFVEGVLTNCLRETREQVDYCAYYRDGGEEYITIVFENGQSIDANVTASSNLAMLYDVYKALTQ